VRSKRAKKAGPCELLPRRAKRVVPVVPWRSQTLDGRIEGDHGASHGLAGRVGIEAAADLVALVKERAKPARVGAGAGRGDASMLRMEGKAADGVNGRLAQDDGRDRSGGNGEVAPVLLGAWGHAPPGLMICSAEFGADRDVFLSQEKEDGIGSVIGIEAAVIDKRESIRAGGRRR